jgi:hypothetical protein
MWPGEYRIVFAHDQMRSTHTVRIVAGVSTDVYVSVWSAAPAAPAAPAPSGRLMASGIALAGIGTAMVALGGGLLAVSSSQRTPAPPNCSFCFNFDSAAFGEGIAGIALMALGGVSVLVGVPLIVVGAQQARNPARTSRPLWAIPVIAPGPRSVALKWTF